MGLVPTSLPGAPRGTLPGPKSGCG